LLVVKDTVNEFRISQHTLPKYIKLEVWKTYLFFDKTCMVDSRDVLLNSKKLADEILIKVIKGVEGSKK
jgi:hypothetical protein